MTLNKIMSIVKLPTHCELILGPMFSGKSTSLLQRVERASISNYQCLIIRFEFDNRFGNTYTHSGRGINFKWKSNIHEIRSNRLVDVEIPNNTSLIAVDEGQFFADLPEAVDKWMREHYQVIISALDGDYLRRPFGRISETIPLATHITKLSSVCTECIDKGKTPADASYTMRITPDKRLYLIGAQEAYKAVCLDCYLAATQNNTAV